MAENNNTDFDKFKNLLESVGIPLPQTDEFTKVAGWYRGSDEDRLHIFLPTQGTGGTLITGAYGFFVTIVFEPDGKFREIGSWYGSDIDVHQNM